MGTDDARQQGAPFFIRFDSQVYDLDTVKRAAYRFTDRCAFDFRIEGNQITCLLSPLKTTLEVADLAADFQNEVLDQDLRRKIAEETAPIRNAVLAYAFSKSGLQSGE